MKNGRIGIGSLFVYRSLKYTSLKALPVAFLSVTKRKCVLRNHRIVVLCLLILPLTLFFSKMFPHLLVKSPVFYFDPSDML